MYKNLILISKQRDITEWTFQVSECGLAARIGRVVVAFKMFQVFSSPGREAPRKCMNMIEDEIFRLLCNRYVVSDVVGHQNWALSPLAHQVGIAVGSSKLESSSKVCMHTTVYCTWLYMHNMMCIIQYVHVCTHTQTHTHIILHIYIFSFLIYLFIYLLILYICIYAHGAYYICLWMQDPKEYARRYHQIPSISNIHQYTICLSACPWPRTQVALFVVPFAVIVGWLLLDMEGRRVRSWRVRVSISQRGWTSPWLSTLAQWTPPPGDFSGREPAWDSMGQRSVKI